MNEFTRNLDELLYLSGTKNNMVRHLRKNYRENIHYINHQKFLAKTLFQIYLTNKKKDIS